MTATEPKSREFSGSSIHTVDAKNRLTVPARWRFEDLPVWKAVPDLRRPCLRLMEPAMFREIVLKLKAAQGIPQVELQRLLSRLTGSAFDSPVDAAGRIQLVSQHVTNLGLSGQVMVSGAWDFLEVWPLGRWESDVDQALPLSALDDRLPVSI